MSYQKQGKSYSSKSRNRKREELKPYNRTKDKVPNKKLTAKKVKKQINRAIKKDLEAKNKPRKVDNETIIKSQSSEILWFSFTVRVSKFRKRIEMDSANKIAKFIIKNAGLFLTNLNEILAVDKIFNQEEVAKYIHSKWKMRSIGKKSNNKVVIDRRKDGSYKINFNITELFKEHQMFKLNKLSISRTMMLKTSMFEYGTLDDIALSISPKTPYKWKSIPTTAVRYISPYSIYVLFWDDKKLIEQYVNSNSPEHFIDKNLAISYIMAAINDNEYGKFKVKKIESTKTKFKNN